MRSLVLLVLVATAIISVSCRETKGDNRPLRPPPKGKRGIVEYSGGYSSGGSSYNSPLISSGYSGGSYLGHSAGIQSLGGGSLGHGSLGYSLGSGGLSLGSGLSHGAGLQGISLGGHFGQSSYFRHPRRRYLFRQFQF
ncbi:keratin, type II cytoskeletal 1-like [Bombus impatiens]|uniref:Keratin, type II cytoskeletal 1-like n=1 Tax=Bombus impatiens TaxID=132113 RepID=A0A6P8L156_BOMIM|nr:keratin, type II cytoskeletal 1-like [Bombus impatiens]